MLESFLTPPILLPMRLATLVVVGKNSILLYMGHEIIDGFVPFAVYFTEESEDRHWGVTLSNAIGVTIWVWIALELDKRKIWVSV